ncbi:MAG: CorA family divalent cation transporter, partial [Candidatus Binatia bacterium]
MGSDDGLIRSYVLDRVGGGRLVDWQKIAVWRPEAGPLWVHLDRGDPNTEAWLRRQSGLDAVAVEALLEPETRPRCTPLPDGWLVVMRGVNLNPGDDPEDMVALRIWVNEERIITVRRRRLMAVQDVQTEIEAAQGPIGPGGILVSIAGHLANRIGPVVAGLDERLDALEIDFIESSGEMVRLRLAALRRQAIALRRHIGPQRDALIGLIGAKTPVLDDRDRLRLREVADHVTRYVEDLD